MTWLKKAHSLKAKASGLRSQSPRIDPPGIEPWTSRSEFIRLATRAMPHHQIMGLNWDICNGALLKKKNPHNNLPEAGAGTFPRTECRENRIPANRAPWA